VNIEDLFPADQANDQYIALLNDDKGNGPLKQYFLGETMHGADAGIL